MSIYVSGSLAFDRIMTFRGNFQDHILMDRLHMLNVSFMVDGMEERNGGCAGNIAYSLALLGEKPVIVSSAGRDFDGYAARLRQLGLPLEGWAALTPSPRTQGVICGCCATSSAQKSAKAFFAAWNLCLHSHGRANA